MSVWADEGGLPRAEGNARVGECQGGRLRKADKTAFEK